jgi:hypothetical protein
MKMVEALGAHPYLTDAVTLLGAAMERVANFVELDPPADPNVTSVVVLLGGVECKIVAEKREVHEDVARLLALQYRCEFVRLEPGYTPNIPHYANVKAKLAKGNSGGHPRGDSP